METAVEAIEEAEGGKAAPEHVKFLSLSYKGLVQPAVVREREKGDRRKEVCHLRTWEEGRKKISLAVVVSTCGIISSLSAWERKEGERRRPSIWSALPTSAF